MNSTFNVRMRLHIYKVLKTKNLHMAQVYKIITGKDMVNSEVWFQKVDGAERLTMQECSRSAQFEALWPRQPG